MYNIKKTVKRFGSLFIAGVMTLSLAACGSGSSNTGSSASSATETPEYVYVPTYVSLGDDEDMSLYSSQFVGDNLYYRSYNWDDDGGSSVTIHKYSLAENKEISSAVLCSSDADSNVSRWINSYCVTDDGQIYTIESVSDYSNENNPYSAYMICVYDADYNKLSEVDAGEASGNTGDDFYINSIVIDGEGRIYLFAESSVLLFDSELAYKGSVDASDAWFNTMGVGKDGNVYVSTYDVSAGGYVLKSVDFDKKSFGQTYQNFLSGNGGNNLVKGIDADFLVSDGTKVYEYSLDSQTTTELFTWLDSDIFGDYVNNMSVTDDGRIIVAINDWSTDENEIAYLTKTKSSEVAQKEQITIGALYSSQEMQAAAVAFNKQSDKYHVNIKYYRDTNDYSETAYSDAITAMNSDIVSSNCPDLIEISSVNIPQMAAKGAFEDLNTWLDKSSSLNKSDYYENILNSATYNDCLVYIPRTFSLQTLAGKSSIVGDERGWSVDDIIAVSKEYPDAQLMEYGTKSSMLYYMMAYNQDAFIDYTTGKCSFDSDSFKKILEFVASFPDEYDWSSDGDSTPTKLTNGQILLYSDYISQLEDIQLAPALFGEDVTFIGYPTVDGSVGCMLNTNGGYAMLSKSQNKEAAWAFIEYCLNRDDTMFSWGFPSKKADMQALIDDALDIEYLTDENGNLVLDEDGNPISTKSHGGMGWDDWEYEYHDVTQEEVDLILELIDEASPASDTDDQIMSIITEETESYFAGQKSVDDVASVIQSRVQLYISENS